MSEVLLLRNLEICHRQKNRLPTPHQSITEILQNCIFQNDFEKVPEFNSPARRMYDEINNNDRNAENYTLRITA
jgi:hypothetical protein